jgi:hypothetical protein
MALAGRWVSACPTSAGPSTTRESRNIGTGTTRPDHTVSDSPEAERTRRESTLPIAQASAAARVSSRPTSGVDADRPKPTTARPTAPIATATTCLLVGRSPRLKVAMSTVSSTCACSTSEARPGGMSSSSAR